MNMGVSKNRGTQNGWFIVENPIRMDDLGVPPFYMLQCFNFRCYIFSSGSIFYSHVMIKNRCAYVYIFILTLQFFQIDTFVVRLTSLVFVEHRNDLVEVIVLSWYWTHFMQLTMIL